MAGGWPSITTTIQLGANQKQSLFRPETATGEIWSSEDSSEHRSKIITGLAPTSEGAHYASLVTD